ncbi:DNA primase family protein [Staphylococcus saprophyticus]|uniref:DNA primase family protein n=1 Tax=Staphylococcus saprophyticus TaxID=29385 RepID=UPI001013C514|nr:DNA primase family protein [Staphylococcus saprophyticus]MBN6092372.1 DNA primase family protein [Staphylococcus saprophyticus]MDW4312494.1 phage/plasmid primase, P4 family [Staphylococcus saprophyticus]MDW4371583.1 phage/plasmid primase, P4 family [Staphylococcus saprophyticus]RXS01975.1 nucleoside triphosphatase [Staphylococcus saprophyticus]
MTKEISSVTVFEEIEKNQKDESIQQRLENIGFQERQDMEKVWEAEGKKGRKPNTIEPNRCAYLLRQELNFLLFDNEENTKLSVYLEDEGIYTQNVFTIKKLISYIEPKFNSRKADDVIYHIKNKAQIRPKTNAPHLIPVKNGIFNQNTKRLERFTPEYVFTTKIDTDYVHNPVKPTFDNWDVDEWFDEIACQNGQVSHLLWQVVSDSLNGNYTRKQAIFMVGDGNNAKGTFQEMLINLIGKRNIAALKVNEFDQRFKLSLLEGKTAVIGDDVPVGVYIDDGSNFKSVITGDYVLIEFKNQQPYSVQFRCTVIQSSNGMPRFKDKTDAVFKRFVIVPFNANFKGVNENRKIKDEYIKDPQVLEYILNKAINMDFEKFDIPDISKRMLDEYKQDINPIYDFKINVFDNWRLRIVPKYIVYGFYKKFCDENGYKPVSNRSFHSEFKKLLPNYWKTDGQARVTWDELIDEIGDLNQMRGTYIDFPAKNKNEKVYINENLAIVS